MNHLYVLYVIHGTLMYIQSAAGFKKLEPEQFAQMVGMNFFAILGMLGFSFFFARSPSRRDRALVGIGIGMFLIFINNIRQ